MLEFYLFILLITFGVICIVFEKKLLYYIYIIFFILFMLVVRMKFDLDIQHYADTMLSFHTGIYYFKEFIFWYGQYYLFQIFHSQYLVFIVMDLLWIYIMIKLVKNNNNYNIAFYNLIVIYFTSFMFFLGYENIYRQFYATIIALYGYSFLNKNNMKAFILFLVAIFIHNTMLLLFPIFLFKLKNINFRSRFILLNLLLFLIAISLKYVSQFKSGEPTGSDTSLYYILLFLVIILFYTIKLNFKIFKIFKIFPSIYYSVIMLIELKLILHIDMITERIGILLLVFLIYDLNIYLLTKKRYKNKILYILLELFIFSLPIFAFSNARSFLN